LVLRSRAAPAQPDRQGAGKKGTGEKQRVPGFPRAPVRICCVQAETLVADTVAGMLPSFPNGPAILEKIKAPLSAFSARWSAE
jgi:hypothetical protein